jgi:hypothetical protein
MSYWRLLGKMPNREDDMNEYMLTDDQGGEFTYAASDMRMALVVHEQLHGTNVQKAEQI